MITVYNKNETNFNNNGLSVLPDVISCLITEELNGVYELEFQYPLDKNNKWQYLVEENIIKANGQLFRIYKKSKSLNPIKIYARHIFYDLLDNFLEDVRPTDQTGAGALDWVLSNTQYEHSFVSSGDVGGNNTKYFIRKNPVDAIMGNDGIIVNWGGEILRNNFSISLLQARGQDRGVLISYGKNIQGIEETLDIDGICTRLMPIGKDGLLLTEKYIDSQYINNYSHPKISVVTFNECADEASLRAAGQVYMESSSIDIPKFNYKIDFIELTKTEEYKNYSILETVYQGDTVTIKHNKLNINLKAKVIKTIYNPLTKRLDKIELGNFKANFASSINNSAQTIQKQIEDTKSYTDSVIENVTMQINSALGGYAVKRNGEFLIMDTEDVMTAVKIWRWNQNGLGYSSNGYNGDFKTAITADGQIVGDFITTGKIAGEAMEVDLNNSMLSIGPRVNGVIKPLIKWSLEGQTFLGDEINQEQTATSFRYYNKYTNETILEIKIDGIHTPTLQVDSLFKNGKYRAFHTTLTVGANKHERHVQLIED